MLQMHCIPYATVWKIEGLDSGVNSVRTSAECGSDRQAGSSAGSSGGCRAVNARQAGQKQLDRGR